VSKKCECGESVFGFSRREYEVQRTQRWVGFEGEATGTQSVHRRGCNLSRQLEKERELQTLKTAC
jgi:hypothetical protein